MADDDDNDVAAAPYGERNAFEEKPSSEPAGAAAAAAAAAPLAGPNRMLHSSESPGRVRYGVASRAMAMMTSSDILANSGVRASALASSDGGGAANDGTSNPAAAAAAGLLIIVVEEEEEAAAAVVDGGTWMDTFRCALLVLRGDAVNEEEEDAGLSVMMARGDIAVTAFLLFLLFLFVSVLLAE